MSPQQYLSLGTASLVGLGCLLLAVVNLRGTDHVPLGLILGTLFGQTAIAASWTAFGPGPCSRGAVDIGLGSQLRASYDPIDSAS